MVTLHAPCVQIQPSPLTTTKCASTMNSHKNKQKEKADDENNQLFVFFPEDEKVGVKPIKILTDRMKDENVSNAILVLRGDITPFAKQAVLEMSDSFRIEHFKEAELLVDITEHTLVSIFLSSILAISILFCTREMKYFPSLTHTTHCIILCRSRSIKYSPKMKNKNSLNDTVFVIHNFPEFNQTIL